MMTETPVKPLSDDRSQRTLDVSRFSLPILTVVLLSEKKSRNGLLVHIFYNPRGFGTAWLQCSRTPFLSTFLRHTSYLIRAQPSAFAADTKD